MSKDKKVYLSNEIDMSKLTYSKKEKVGPSENCKLVYDGVAPLNLQVPRIKVPFGLSIPKEEYNPSGKDKFSFELSLDTSNQKIAEFKKVLEKIDEFNLKYVAEHSMELFGDVSTVEEVKKHKLYTSMFKASVDKDTKQKNGKYPDRVKVKLQVYEKTGPNFKIFKNDEELSFYNVATKEIDWSWVENGMEILPLIQSEGFWVVNGKVHFVWKLVSAKITNGAPGKFGIDNFRADEDETQVEEEVNN